ncbi:hypothetical protein [Sphingobium limneticum]|jgi:hypothetical protein|nr:hypothetical protein [Sphingobium limneticum]
MASAAFLQRWPSHHGEGEERSKAQTGMDASSFADLMVANTQERQKAC